jgi:DNA polymerase-3 subunit epsilon
MTRSRLGRRLGLAALGLFLLPALAAGIALVVLLRRGLLADPGTLLVVMTVGLLAPTACAAIAVHGLGRSLVRAVVELHHGTELMASVNPAHRHAVSTGDELEALGAEINRLADRLQEARADLAARVAAASRELEAERRMLSAILGDLAEAVVVATLDGRIILANRMAREALAGGRPVLGEDLYSLVARGDVAPVLERLRPLNNRPERLSLRLQGGLAVACGMSPLLDAAGKMTGFVLALRSPEPSDPGTARPAGGGPGAPRPAFRGAGLVSGVAAATPSPPVPELHDLALLEQTLGRAAPASRARPLLDTTFVVFDTETTGLDPRAGHRILSLAAVRVRGGVVRPGEMFDALIDPRRPVPPESIRFHGITDAMLAGAPAMDEVLPAFLEFAADAVLVGHEVSFDLAFLAVDTARLGLVPLAERQLVLDTRLLSRAVHGAGADHNLEAVAARLGVEIRARHSALGDALATAEILVRLLVLLDGRGVTTLGGLLDLLRRSRPAI